MNNSELGVQCSMLNVKQFLNYSQFTICFDPDECLVQDCSIGRWQSASITNAKCKKISGELRSNQSMLERYL
jgi:hypothetical protein